mmetsp:Transcript_5649/g.11707  ORF Transcript_5649/g.11707 Transcript_5649/m.11707 type:complete len:517 (-) Transcript_5649:215-1765(-)
MHEQTSIAWSSTITKEAKVRENYKNMSDNNESRKRPANKDAGVTGESPSNKKVATTMSKPVADKSNATGASVEWNKKLNMSPPRKKVDGKPMKEEASLDEVERAMHEDGMDRYLLHGDEQPSDLKKIVYFLYGIEYCKNTIQQERVEKIEKFLHGEAKDRMMDLLKKDSDVSNSSENLPLWNKVQAVVLCYGNQNGALTIFDGKNIPVVMRTQATKNCYQHATGSTVGYTIAFMKGDNEHTIHTVDVAKAMRHYYDDRKLELRILENKGGVSEQLLRSMVADKGLDIGITLSPDVLQLAHFYLRTRGPALVSRFSTDDFFKSTTGDYFANEKYHIPQFDRVNNQDTQRFLELGVLSEDQEKAVTTMKEKNMKLEGVEGDAPSPGIPIRAVSHSFSSESHENGSETDSIHKGAVGLHAMTLIGGRKDDSGNVWFLLQNTWASLPVFEASESYLAHHLRHQGWENGKLLFISGHLQPGTELPLTDRGLCLELTDCNDVEEVEYGLEEDEEPNDIDLEE